MRVKYAGWRCSASIQRSRHSVVASSCAVSCSKAFDGGGWRGASAAMALWRRRGRDPLDVGSQLMVICRKGERPECLRERGRGRHVGGLPWLGCSPGRRYQPGVSGLTSMTLELDSELEQEGLRCYRETEGSEVVPKVEGEEGTRAAAGICVHVYGRKSGQNYACRAIRTNSENY